MGTFQKATRLIEITQAAELEPLPSGDARYQEMSAGRSSDDLLRMKKLLTGFGGGTSFAKIAFTGHRGCGKSTELLRLEHDMGEFTCLHVAVEDDIVQDCDYTDLFLWLAEALMVRFKDFDSPLAPRLASAVAEWFAEVTEEDSAKRMAEISLGAEAELSGKLGAFATALKIMARLKSSIIGSVERRRIVRQKLQRHASDLVSRLNGLLDEARATLERNRRAPDLLIVIDNLDRVDPQVGETLFFTNGNLLKALRAHVIYTAPIALVLAPNNIGTVFNSSFTLSMVKVRTREGRAFRKGIDDLVLVVERRVDVDLLFASRKVVRYLARMSGGSVRDLMHLLQHAQVEARIADRESIDMASAKKAVRSIRIQYERVLIPSQVYFPLLARVHLSHRDYLADAAEADPSRIRDFRTFFSQLLFNGSILEYDGGETWYDVHPIVQEIRAFKEAVADVRGDRAQSV